MFIIYIQSEPGKTTSLLERKNGILKLQKHLQKQRFKCEFLQFNEKMTR